LDVPARMAVAGGEGAGASTNDMTQLLFACMQKRCVCARMPAPCHGLVLPPQCVVGTRALRRQVASAPGRARQRTGIDAAPLVSGRRDDVERMLSQEKYLSVLNMHQQDGWTGRLKVAVKENSGIMGNRP